MKTGTYYWFGYEMENKRKFELIKDAGFDCVTLWWGDELAVYDEDKVVILDKARASGLEVENIHAPYQYTDEIWTDSMNSESVVDRYARYIDDCAQHGIPTVVVHLSDGECKTPPSQLGLDRYKRLVELAERKNVNFALENVKNKEHLHYLLSNIQSARLGFCYDSGHENCYDYGSDFLGQYGNRLMALHLHDNDGSKDHHWIPGDGTVHWSSIVQKIKSSGYDGAISLEVINDFTGDYSTMPAQEFLLAANVRIKRIFG